MRFGQSVDKHRRTRMDWPGVPNLQDQLALSMIWERPVWEKGFRRMSVSLAPCGIDPLLLSWPKPPLG